MSFFFSGNPVVEDFEDGDIAEYSLDTGSFSVQSTTVFHANNALEVAYSTNSEKRIVSTDFSVSNGETYRVNVRFPTTNLRIYPVFGVQDETSLDGYAIGVEPDSGNFKLFEVTDGSFTEIAADTSVSYSTGIWYEIEFDWGSGGSLTVTLFDDTGTQVAQITVTDSTYTSGGIGWRVFNTTTSSQSAYFDYLRRTS